MRRPPGPKPASILGNFPMGRKDSLELLTGWAAEFGDIFHYRALWMHVYFLNHPDYIEYVMVRNPRNFTKDPALRNMRWLLGEGLLTSEGEHWKRQRRLVQPPFHRDRIAAYADIMTRCTEDALAHWQDGAELDIHREMMALTLRIVVRCLFSVETDETAAISRALDVLMRGNMGLRLLIPSWLRRVPLPGQAEFRNATQSLDRAVSQIVAARRAAGPEGNADDLLGILMAARDEDGGRMDDRQTRDEVMTFFLAGHETTALALSWTFYLLSRNPEAVSKLHQELAESLEGRAPQFSDLPRLVWTDAIVKEVLRLYPPAWAMGRLVVDTFEIGGYQVPKGSLVVSSQYVMQRSSRYFREPDRFDPARWTTGETQSLPRFVYFPFSGGPRQCIGNNFASMEAVLLLATIAQRFEVRFDPAADIVPVTGFTLRPRGAMSARVIERR